MPKQYDVTVPENRIVLALTPKEADALSRILLRGEYCMRYEGAHLSADVADLKKVGRALSKSKFIETPQVKCFDEVIQVFQETRVHPEFK